MALTRSEYSVFEPEFLESHPFTALLQAIISEDRGTAENIIASEPDRSWNICPNELPAMTPPLIQAIWRGNTQIVELLVQHALRQSINTSDLLDVAFGGSPLHWAATAGHDQLLLNLLDQDKQPNVNIRSFEGWTPLHAAAGHGHLPCVHILLGKNADPNIVDSRKSSPLHEAAQWGHGQVARRLLEARALVDPFNVGRETPLLLAARSGHTHVMQHLLQSGASVDVSNEAGVTPLMSAAFFGHNDAVSLLLERGADASAADRSRKRTPAHWAAFNNNTEALKALIRMPKGPSAAALLEAAMEGDALEALAFLRSL